MFACVSGALLPAQVRPLDPEREAVRLTQLLELDDRAPAAYAGIWRIGSAAAPPLLRKLDDPRPDVVERAGHVLGLLGGRAKGVVGGLDALLAQPDPHPVVHWARSRVQPFGITLIADYSGNQIREVDADGKVVHRVTNLKGAFGAERLPNGNYLVVEYSAKRVREIRRDGTEVWKIDNLSQPLDADRLINGNTLISVRSAKRVFEADPSGKVVWQLEGLAVQEADRLPNGNTLLCIFDRGEVREVDTNGDIVWRQKGLASVTDADRLANGNTLITTYKNAAVREFTPTGEVVFEVTGLTGASSAQRLPNGNTLVADRPRILEYDPTGKVVRTIDVGYGAEAQRY